MQREGLYQALRQAFARRAFPGGDVITRTRGDGAFVLARPGIPKDLFAGSLPGELVTALRQHNEARPAQEQIRLRMAIHAGEVIFDDHGATSAAANLAFRLLDAAPLKAALAVIRPPLPSATPRSAQPIAPLSCGETIVPASATRPSPLRVQERPRISASDPATVLSQPGANAYQAAAG